MKKEEDFPFERARRITPEEVEMFRRAIEQKTGKKRPKRKGPKPLPFKSISIRLHPFAYQWIKEEAKRKGLKPQELINQVLLKKAMA